MPAGWGEVDDEESIRAVGHALDLGITLFDTADVYGCGHSERVLGRALAGRRDDVVIVTKVGNCFDEQTRTGGGTDLSPAYLRRACDASLRRLGTDRIDVYLIHDGLTGPQDVPPVSTCSRNLWPPASCAGTARASPTPRSCGHGRRTAHGRRPARLSVLRGDSRRSRSRRSFGLASLNRTPLAMGLLSGRYRPDALPDADDVRRNAPWWDFFDPGAMEG